MEDLRVPQREVQVRLQMSDGRNMGGVMYVPPVAPAGGEGHIIDRLNAATGQFLPLTEEGGRTHLVRAAQILTVRVHEERAEDMAADRFGRQLQVAVHLTTGVRLVGRLSFLPASDHDRLQDYLNIAPRFISLHLEHDRVYVNRDQITSVVALGGEGEAEG